MEFKPYSSFDPPVSEADQNATTFIKVLILSLIVLTIYHSIQNTIDNQQKKAKKYDN